MGTIWDALKTLKKEWFPNEPTITELPLKISMIVFDFDPYLPTYLSSSYPSPEACACHDEALFDDELVIFQPVWLQNGESNRGRLDLSYNL